MKKLEEYRDEIYKCSKCGLCQSVCPLYEHFGLESAVSRGKFALLNAVLENKLKITMNISKAMDFCLTCKACDNFCPSGIKVEEIILSARAKCFEELGLSLKKSFVNLILANNYILKAISLFICLYKAVKLNKFNIFFFLPKKLKLNINIFNKLITEKIDYKKTKKFKATKNIKLMYYPGCINRYFNKSVENALRTVLELNGYELLPVPDFSCCGMTAKNIGDFKTYKKLAQKNLKLIAEDIDYLIIDCASCYATWQNYKEIGDEIFIKNTKKVTEKLIHINELIYKLNLNISRELISHDIVTYHEPCHLKSSKSLSQLSKNLILSLTKNNFAEMEEFDKCCGMAGTFMVCNQKYSEELMKYKANNIEKSKADVVLTDCSGCKIGLLKSSELSNYNFSVYQPIELIAEVLNSNNL